MSKAKGEVGFEADGKRYTLVYSVDALCELEDALGASIAKIGEVFSDPGKPQLRTVKTAFWAGLTDHHPEVTIKGASELMRSIGIMRATALFSEAFSLAFPETEKGPLDGSTVKSSQRRAPTGAQP